MRLSNYNDMLRHGITLTWEVLAECLALVVGICQNEDALANIATGLLTLTDPSDRLRTAPNESGNGCITKSKVPQICEELLNTVVPE
jgi:hypothetical protein